MSGLTNQQEMLLKTFAEDHDRFIFKSDIEVVHGSIENLYSELDVLEKAGLIYVKRANNAIQSPQFPRTDMRFFSGQITPRGIQYIRDNRTSMHI